MRRGEHTLNTPQMLAAVTDVMCDSGYVLDEQLTTFAHKHLRPTLVGSLTSPKEARS